MSKEKSREKKLIEQFVLTKNDQLFVEIVQPHLSWLKRLVASIFNGNVSDMEDALQEILAAFISECGRFNDHSTLKTFFYSFARFKAIDHLRKIRRDLKRLEKIHTEIDDGQKHNPEEVFMGEEIRQEVRSALDALEPDNRLLLTMKECEGFSIGEIAAITGKKPGTIKSRLHRSRNKIAEYLKRRII